MSEKRKLDQSKSSSLESMKIEQGKRLSRIRENLKMNQQELAEAVGKSTNMISRYENGVSMIPQDVLTVLHNEYGVDLNFLITGTEVTGNMEEIIKAMPIERICKYLKLMTSEIERRNK